MKYYLAQFKDPIWIYGEHFIRILFFQEDLLYFEVCSIQETDNMSLDFRQVAT